MRQLKVLTIVLLLWGAGGSAPAAEEVTLSTADGVTLSGTYYAPDEDEASAVILLHDLGRERSDWEDLAEELQGEDYAVLAFDLRGHGKSTQKGGETISYKSMSDADFGNAVQDVQAAYQYLAGREGVDQDHIAVVGAGLGANLALKFATKERRLKTLVLLSPGLSIKGLHALEDMDRYGERPVLLAASLKDAEAADAVRQLEKAARGERNVKVYKDASHGTEMLKKEEDLLDLIVDWLDDTL
jgi:alpha-beta hydrolase superfamily lysophospholipase